MEKWTEIYTRLSRADQDGELGPEELEELALSSYLTGREPESFKALERAHQSYLEQGNIEKAVRCAFWLGFTLIDSGEKGRGGGWIATAERILKDAGNPECPESGLLLIPQGLMHLSARNGDKAQDIFEVMASKGDQFDDPDVKALGRLGLGQAMIMQGDIETGIKLFDETLITVENEDVFPVVHGIVYCAVIESCRKMWDLGRAREWTSALTRWCDSQPDLVPFRGECLVRRAEIFQLYGEWPKALEESRNACDILTRNPGKPAAGEAYYRQAELHRLIGNLEQAGECYREAAKRGRSPQPGLALIRLAQGKKEDAETSIRNSLKELSDDNKRAELLPAFIHIMLECRQIPEAVEASKELCVIAAKLNRPYLLAICAHCRGEVFLAEGIIQPALEQFRKALNFWNSLNLPYETACTRELKGRAYQKLDDKDNSEAQLAAAQWVYNELNARPDVERIDRLLKKDPNYETHDLSLRELQVLKLVASGMTNRIVANKLFISERTVDRHVSNIFNKLGVSTRVEATTFALRNKVLDEDAN